ncbi:MAG: hypothetical protein ABI647_12855 [Gemmatimonadota bacterium]
MTAIDIAGAAVRVVAAYLVVGAVFAGWFVTTGAGRLDPAAAKGSVGFRLLITPGAMTLWPVLLWKSVRAPHPMPQSPDHTP